MLISLLVIGGATAFAVRLASRPRTVDDDLAGAEAVISAADASPLVEDASAPETSKAAEAADEPAPGDSALSVDRNLVIAGSALALNVAAVTVAPPIALLSAVPLTVVTVPFLRRAWHMRSDPDRRWVALLDSVSCAGTLVTGHFFACALGTTLIYGSMKLLGRTRRRIHADLHGIFGDLPTRAWVLRSGVEVEVSLEEVEADDLVIVRAGQQAPVDGVVVEGVGAADERAFSGESVPAAKSLGDEVFASTLITEGPLTIRVSRTGAETAVGQLNRILNNTDDLTEHCRSKGETIVERGALPTLVISAVTLPLLGVSGALAVTFAAFGYHMRVAAPLSALGYIALAARQGVLVKDARALELLAEVDVVLFDKTGTLTADRPEVVAVRPVAGVDASTVLRMAAAAEQDQAHPIARSILEAARAEGIEPVPVERLEVAVGAGLRAWFDGALVTVGSARLMDHEGAEVPASLHPMHDDSAVVYVARDRRIIGLIELVTPARAEARSVIDALKARGVEVGLVSGDRRGPVERLAGQLGIERVHAEVRPEDKSEIVSQLQSEGRRVCFVGDGINDAIALKAADVSVSLSGASAVATDTAALVMLDGDLTRLPDLLGLAADFDRNIERGRILTVAPGVLCVGGVYLVHAGLGAAIMLYNTALAGSVANALEPTIGLLGRRRDDAVASPTKAPHPAPTGHTSS